MTQIDPALTERQQYWLKHIRACDAACPYQKLNP